MPLDWECLDPDYCHRAPAPLFGNIRVERHGAKRGWSVNWSVSGYSASLIAGEWPDAEAAMRADPVPRRGPSRGRGPGSAATVAPGA
jgi:hypothetical protein